MLWLCFARLTSSITARGSSRAYYALILRTAFLSYFESLWVKLFVLVYIGPSSDKSLPCALWSVLRESLLVLYLRTFNWAGKRYPDKVFRRFVSFCCTLESLVLDASSTSSISFRSVFVLEMKSQDATDCQFWPNFAILCQFWRVSTCARLSGCICWTCLWAANFSVLKVGLILFLYP